MSRTLPLLLGLSLASFVATAPHAGPVDRAKQAVDPDCTVTKAAKGAARKAAIGIGNRCGVGETARDVTGVDGKGEAFKDRERRRDRKRSDD